MEGSFTLVPANIAAASRCLEGDDGAVNRKTALDMSIRYENRERIFHLLGQSVQRFERDVLVILYDGVIELLT